MQLEGCCVKIDFATTSFSESRCIRTDERDYQ
jgi:hypothetical protein